MHIVRAVSEYFKTQVNDLCCDLFLVIRQLVCEDRLLLCEESAYYLSSVVSIGPQQDRHERKKSNSCTRVPCGTQLVVWLPEGAGDR